MKALADSLGSPYWVAYGLVDYDFNKHNNVETDEFTKEQDFNYQQEFRIAINLFNEICKVRKNTNSLKYDSSKGVLSLNIGTINDIAFTLPVEDYINLKFPNKYQWVKTTLPPTICTFYPPVKNEISYICPLMRVENVILVSENALYPVKRDTNAFSLNIKRLKKALMFDPAHDTFFLTVINSYFCHLLDIYKSKKNQSLLDQILTAIMYYMLELGISDCAKIHLEIDNGKINASYNDIYLHDTSLLDINCYEIVQVNLAYPKPSDFAVLVSLSNQTTFEEYELDGRRYVRVEIAKDGVLPSGKVVNAGEAIWVESTKVKFKGY